MNKVGDIVFEKKRFTANDVRTYADLTGDFNPIHFDENYAKETIFKKPIVPGPLVITLVTTLFATKLPGPGSVYLSHDVKYLHPVYLNDIITARLEILEITDKSHVIIETICTNEEGIMTLKGVARLKKF